MPGVRLDGCTRLCVCEPDLAVCASREDVGSAGVVDCRVDCALVRVEREEEVRWRRARRRHGGRRPLGSVRRLVEQELPEPVPPNQISSEEGESESRRRSSARGPWLASWSSLVPPSFGPSAPMLSLLKLWLLAWLPLAPTAPLDQHPLLPLPHLEPTSSSQARALSPDPSTPQRPPWIDPRSNGGSLLNVSPAPPPPSSLPRAR